MAKIKPLGDKILVEILEAEEKTKGGIFLPDTAKEEKTEVYSDDYSDAPEWAGGGAFAHPRVRYRSTDLR